MSDNKDGNVKDVVEILEEDDEFEEFENANWDDAQGNDEGQLWQDDWDDVDTNDDFTDQLRQHIESKSSS